MLTFQIRKATGTQPYYWRAVASNGRVLCHSETYANRADARAAVDTVKAGRVSYEVTSSVNHQWFFRIKATNGRILAHSETYHNHADAQLAADYVRTNAPSARIEDLAA